MDNDQSIDFRNYKPPASSGSTTVTPPAADPTPSVSVKNIKVSPVAAVIIAGICLGIGGIVYLLLSAPPPKALNSQASQVMERTAKQPITPAK